MLESVRQQYESFPDPSPEAVPIGPGQLDRIDDGLHFGWSWHRYRYCYRRNDALKVLDAGCGTGLSTLGLARLNPGSSVVGIDVSGPSLDLARRRAEASGIDRIEFREQDLDDPVSAGPFDFVVARGVLGQAEDPGRSLASLARALDRRGLLLATFPSRWGRQAARLLRRAVDTIVPPEASLKERGLIGSQLLGSLKPEHPIRQDYNRRFGGGAPTIGRVVAGYLGVDERDWDLEDAVAALEQAGLRFLYAAAFRPWRPDLAFGGEVPADLKNRVNALPERDQAILIDTLDPGQHGESYRIYACPGDFEPRLPTWIESRPAPAATFDRLIPHPSGLARPLGVLPDPAAARGRVTYRAVSGAPGEIDSRADAALRLADGRQTIAAIENRFPPELPETRQARWRGLADLGFLLLEDPDPRQHVDCVHLGPVVDRLNCPCPRAWVRSCERHDICTIDAIESPDPRVEALGRAAERLGRTPVISCERCPDYISDE